MTKVAKNVSYIDDISGRFFTLNFVEWYILWNFHYAQNTCFNYTVTPVTTSHTQTYSYKCNGMISTDVCGICRHAAESSTLSMRIAQTHAMSQQCIPVSATVTYQHYCNIPVNTLLQSWVFHHFAYSCTKYNSRRFKSIATTYILE
jgi:hypothetical protein